MKYCKYAIGTHNRSTNYAILGELGRYPLLIDIISQILKYLRHVQTNESKNSILQEALKESKQIAINGGISWFSSVTSITKILNISPENMSKMQIKHAKDTLKSNSVHKWSESLRHQSKM